MEVSPELSFLLSVVMWTTIYSALTAFKEWLSKGVHCLPCHYLVHCLLVTRCDFITVFEECWGLVQSKDKEKKHEKHLTHAGSWLLYIINIISASNLISTKLLFKNVFTCLHMSRWRITSYNFTTSITVWHRLRLNSGSHSLILNWINWNEKSSFKSCKWIKKIPKESWHPCCEFFFFFFFKGMGSERGKTGTQIPWMARTRFQITVPVSLNRPSSFF